MARSAKRRSRPKKAAALKKGKSTLPFTKHNYILFAIGIAVLILGYILMSIPGDETVGRANNPLSRTVSPFILIIGYLVIIPVAFMYQHKSLKKQPDTQQQPPNQTG